jgi:hypothetical protein
MTDRRFRHFIFYITINLILFCLIFVHASYERRAVRPELNQKKGMVKSLGLTDLCIFTEARYTRHPSMTDLNSPFQDYPFSFEHFPSGSLIMPPRHLVSR